MPRTPQKPAILANAADQAAHTVPEHTALHPADHEAFFAGLHTPLAPTKSYVRPLRVTAKRSPAGDEARFSPNHP